MHRLLWKYHVWYRQAKEYFENLNIEKLLRLVIQKKKRLNYQLKVFPGNKRTRIIVFPVHVLITKKTSPRGEGDMLGKEITKTSIKIEQMLITCTLIFFFDFF